MLVAPFISHTTQGDVVQGLFTDVMQACTDSIIYTRTGVLPVKAFQTSHKIKPMG